MLATVLPHIRFELQLPAFNRLAAANGYCSAMTPTATHFEGRSGWQLIYTWDYENRLKQSAHPSVATVNSYDALGHRVQRSSSSGSVKKFVYDGIDNLIQPRRLARTISPGSDEAVANSGTAEYHLL